MHPSSFLSLGQHFPFSSALGVPLLWASSVSSCLGWLLPPGEEAGGMYPSPCMLNDREETWKRGRIFPHGTLTAVNICTREMETTFCFNEKIKLCVTRKTREWSLQKVFHPTLERGLG